jgi:hypothetical protein
MDYPKLPKRWYSKTHRRDFIKTRWLEILGEDILDGIAKNNPNAYKLNIAITLWLEKNQKFYREVNTTNE